MIRDLNLSKFSMDIRTKSRGNALKTTVQWMVEHDVDSLQYLSKILEENQNTGWKETLVIINHETGGQIEEIPEKVLRTAKKMSVVMEQNPTRALAFHEEFNEALNNSIQPTAILM